MQGEAGWIRVTVNKRGTSLYPSNSLSGTAWFAGARSEPRRRGSWP